MLPILRSLAAAETSHEVVQATARYLEADLRETPVPLEALGTIRVESPTDIDHCIERIQRARRAVPLMGHDDARVERLLSFLLVASIRVRQVA